MKSLAVMLGVYENVHVRTSRAADPLLVRLLGALVASHEFSLLMPDDQGALPVLSKRGRSEWPKISCSCVSENISSPGMHSPPDR
jgi:hypothetical protein